MAGDRPEDIARAFRVAGESADLRKNEAVLAAICDRDIQQHIRDADTRYPKYPPWTRALARPVASRAKTRVGANLIFSGELKQSMRQRPDGGSKHVQTVSVNEFSYGSNLHYATVQNDGGPSELTIDPSWFRQSKSGGRYVKVDFGDGWRTLTKETISINVRPRPFCFLSGQAMDKAADALGMKIERDWERA